MSQKKLDMEALSVETFEPGEDMVVTPASPDTYATTGGPWFCAVDCGSGGCRTELCG